MTSLLGPFFSLLSSVGILLLGSGLLGTLLAVRMGVEEFPTEVIGVVMACYSIGFVIATFAFPKVIQKVGHIRSFSVLAALAAGSTLTYPLLVEPIAWGLMRGVFGFSLCGMYMVTESWLNDRTPRERRGQVLAFYSITTNAALGGGQFLLALWDVEGFQLFSLASFLFIAALVPVALTRARSPDIQEARPVSVKTLYEITPLGLAGALTSGLVNGAFLGMGPVFAQRADFSLQQVSLLMGGTILGGLVLQYPIGRVSDRYDRIKTILAVAAAAGGLSAAIALAAGGSSPLVVIGLAALWGGLAFTIYPLSLALANDHITPEQLVGAGAGLLMVHGVGMIIGPMAASALMGQIGAGGLFWGITVAIALLVLFAIYRNRVGEHVAPEDQTDYLAVPSTTPVATVLDPRGEEEQLEFDFEAAEEPSEPQPEEGAL